MTSTSSSKQFWHSVSATRIVASTLGVFGGLMSLEHGFFETLQGNAAPSSVIIDAIGHQANSVFQGSEPAFTIIPNFLVTGVLVIIVSLIATVWAAAFVQKKNGVQVLILLSTIPFLVGGGLAPLVIFVAVCAVATKINKPLTFWRAHLSGSVGRFLAKLWPYPFIIVFLPSLINVQTAIFGSFFGVNVPNFSAILFLFIFGLLLLSVVSGFAYDIQKQTDSPQSSSKT
jgi:hypothetical protein